MNNVLDSLKISIAEVNVRTLRKDTWNFNNFIQPFSKIYFVIDGYGEIIHNSKKFLLKPGNIYLIPANSPVTSRCPEKMTKYWIHFNAEIFTGQEIFNILKVDYVSKVKDQNYILSLFEKILLRHTETTLDAILETQALMRLIMVPFLNGISESHFQELLKNILKFKEIFSYIEKNISKPVGLGELSSIMTLSPQHFSSLFKKHIGISPVQYCNRKRMEKAQLLLWGTDKNVAEIAGETGFEDAFYFSRIFKKATGLSPSEYRMKKI